MNLRYNKNWKPIDGDDNITDKFFNITHPLDMEFKYKRLLYTYYIRISRFKDNKDLRIRILKQFNFKIHVYKAHIFFLNFLSFLNLKNLRKIFSYNYNSFPYRNKVFSEFLSKEETYIKYEINYIPSKILKRMKIINNLLK